MANDGYYHSIPDQVFHDIDLSQLTSIREGSFTDLKQSLKKGELRLFLNPEVTHYELQEELSLPEQLFGELIRSAPLLFSMAIGYYAIHTENLVWLLLVLLLPSIYFLRNLIIPLIRLVLPAIFLATALFTFAFWNISGLLASATLLAGSLWIYGLNRYKTNRLFKKALATETKFIELYFKNVFLLFRGEKLLNSPQEVQGFIKYSYQHFPEKLTGKEMLYYCKRCINRDYSQQKGIVCGLTKQKPDFENECPDFDFDPERAEYEDSILATRLDWIEESEVTIKLVPYILYAACAILFLSEVNFWHSGRFFDVFRSGLTEFLALREIYQPQTPFYGLIIPGLLLVTGILASTGKKWAFIAGFIVFLTDTVLCYWVLSGTFNNWSHLIVLGGIIAGIKEIDTIKAVTRSLIGNG